MACLACQRKEAIRDELLHRIRHHQRVAESLFADAVSAPDLDRLLEIAAEMDALAAPGSSRLHPGY